MNRNIPQPLVLKQPRFKMAAAWWHVYRDNPLAQVGVHRLVPGCIPRLTLNRLNLRAQGIVFDAFTLEVTRGHGNALTDPGRRQDVGDFFELGVGTTKVLHLHRAFVDQRIEQIVGLAQTARAG